MKPVRIALLLAAAASLPAQALDPAGFSADGASSAYLGPAPWIDPITLEFFGKRAVAPKSVVATPALDTSSRAAVRSAYNTYYNLSMPALGWTGSVAGCVPGTISLAFQEWTLSRINFLRAMAGVSSSVTLNTSVYAQEQAAALIMQANNTLTHSPASNMVCYTPEGSTGAGQSNIALGSPSLGDSIPLYMSEPGSGNAVVGHRRWILFSGAQQFGLGQTDTGGALWIASLAGSVASVPRPNGIAWPPRGYVPMDLFPTQFTSTQRWSFGLPGADFSAANVSVLLNGVAFNPALTRLNPVNGYGDNTVVWEMPLGHVVTKGTIYDVSITNVAGVSPTAYSYQVRPFDPADPLPVTKRADLNGDGRSDIVWRNSATGQVFRQLMNGFTITNGAMAYNEPNLAWKVVGEGDFNGDGIADLLYRNDVTGQVSIVTFGAAGLPTNASVFFTEPNLAWKIVQTADIDGDGKTDIVWRNSTTGQVYAMLMNGYTIAAQGMVYTEPSSAWKIVASGDFAGSGKQNQLLWRNTTTGQVFLQTVNYSGGFTQSGQIIYTEPNPAWQIVGTGDFNADGKSDILWRNDATGQVFAMLMNNGIATSSAIVYTEPNIAWKIVAQGDYNGDGRADLLWRNDVTGQVYFMQMNGLSIASQAFVYSEPSSAWKILGPLEYPQ